MTDHPFPDPAGEICIATLHAARGINFWSRRPVIRMDMSVGAYDDISSADAGDTTDRLVRAMPGLHEHHCSIGAPGGFVTRLRRGTYAPHIIEHVALELQSMIGHDVGYGRTRGGGAPGEYTVVFEHQHEHVGLRAAALSLGVVQQAFAGTLDSVAPLVTELAMLAGTNDTPAIDQRVLCGITGGSGRAETRQHLIERLATAGISNALVIDVSPADLLQAGIPYSRSEVAVVLDAELTDVPQRYRAADHARRLVGILADAVQRDGVVICPAKDWELQDYARDQDCRVAIFASDDDVTTRDQKVAMAVGRVRDGQIVLQNCGDPISAGLVRDDSPVAPQVAAALTEYIIRNHAE
ncbi:MAG: Cyanophycin synthetase [Gemmatimonadetes bacterium]|nr:Cyanophycin synthetase [Gemmatimonadota bacterium]